MNIVVCTRDLDYGVGSVVKTELDKIVKNKEIKRIYLISPRKLDKDKTKVSQTIISNAGKFFVTKEPNFAFRCNRVILRLLKEQKIDEITTHFPLYANKYEKTKLISKFHTLHLSILRNHPRTPKLLIGAFFHWLYSYFDYRTIKYSDEVLFVSKRTLEEAKIFYPKYADKFRHSPNSIDKSKFFKLSQKEKAVLKRKLNLNDGKKNILYVGRLEPMKGILDLLHAIREMDNNNIRLVVIGDGPLKKKLKKYSFVDYRGKVPNDKLYKYYNAVDLFVLPSHYENSPMTILEAKACGCKVLARDVGDVKNILLNPDRIYSKKEELRNKLK